MPNETEIVDHGEKVLDNVNLDNFTLEISGTEGGTKRENINERQEKEKVMELVRPCPDSPQWQDYVMAQFLPEELDNNSPKVEALRRVAIKLIGPIIKSISEVVQSPNSNIFHQAVVVHTVEILNLHYQEDYGVEGIESLVQTFSGSADCSVTNTEPAYARFATSMAETRARGRAFRHALGLSRCSSEELTIVPINKKKDEEMGIGEHQKLLIEQLCGQLNIRVGKLVAASRNKYCTIDEVSENDADIMIKTLNEWRNSGEIPEKVK